MDSSVSTIESRSIQFNKSLRSRGFTRSIYGSLNPFERSGLKFHHFEIIGIVISGGLAIDFYELSTKFNIGEEFKISSNTYFQATAGNEGVEILLARKRQNFKHSS